MKEVGTSVSEAWPRAVTGVWGRGCYRAPLECPLCTGCRNKKLHGAPAGEKGCQLWSTSEKQGGNGVYRERRLPKSGGCTLCSSQGVSGGGGVNGEDGGCPGLASSRFSFCGKSEGTYKMTPSPPENDAD